MVYSSAESVEQYLAELEPERRSELSAIRELLLQNLPDGLVEAMNFGMICYQVPLATISETYNKQPLMYAALASPKHKISLYLMSIYAFDEVREKFENDWKATGKKLDVGKACIRFRSTEDVPLQVIAEAAGKISVARYVERYLETRSIRKRPK